jgi:hypothetical protein
MRDAKGQLVCLAIGRLGAAGLFNHITMEEIL